MPKICEKCGKEFPYIVVIDGKKRNLGSRKYCLECSSFGKHNTKKLNGEKRKYEPKYNGLFCLQCGKRLKGRQRKYCSHKCGISYGVKERLRRLKQKAVDLMGGKCEICGYDKCIAALDFHHINGKKKEFRISRMGSTKWEKVLEELKKCQLLCSNCHRELHYKEEENKQKAYISEQNIT